MLEGNTIKLSNGKIVNIMSMDAVRLYLDTSDIAFLDPKMDEDNNHIISISLEDKLTINKGDQILLTVGNVKTVYDVVYMVIEKKGKSVVIYSSLPTKTGMFLLPALGKNFNQLKIKSYYVNTYLDYTHEYLCIKYRFTGTQQYKEFEKYMITDPLCVSHLEHGKYHVVYIFKIPLEFKEDVLSFVEGKYSKFSKALKGRIQQFYGREESKPMIDIIGQNKDLKIQMEKYLGVDLPANSELASKPDSNIEIYIPYE
jgi:hypothetical protein